MTSIQNYFLIALPLYFLVIGVQAEKLTDEEYYQLPRLFHLDDYKKCLSVSDGVYCLGVFHLTPMREPHHVYNLMKKHSEDRYNFNRTLIHRGYCLNSRCPPTKNTTRRFEKCVDNFAQKHAMRATLRELHYCRTYYDRNRAAKPSREQTLFIQLLYAILAFNVIGTAYDLMTGDVQDKNKLLMAWSIPANWKRVKYISEGGDPRFIALTPLQGARITGLALVMYAHARLFPFAMYTSNPEDLESVPVNSEGVIFSNGTILVHTFIMLTSFLTSYQFLVYSQKCTLRLHMLPMCIIKRIIRIAPVHILVVGYAATMWGHERDGPLISSTIGTYSKVCRRKFWTHVFFINNFVDKENVCLAPTWYLAVDLHMYILACFLTIIMYRYRRQAIPIYAACFIISLVQNSVTCYLNEWVSPVQWTTSENLKSLFDGVESFSHFYVSTWGALPACFMGLFVGHLHFELQERGINLNDHKWPVLLHHLSLPLGMLWQIKAGKYATQQTSAAFAASFVFFDRLVYFTVICFLLFGAVHINGPFKKLFGWRGWQPLARMSLPIMLIHWIINLLIVARPTVFSTSSFEAIIDWVATIVISYGVAVPMTMLFEIPMQKFLGALL